MGDPCATPQTHSTKAKTGAFRDWRGQISWGRICAAVALVVAVMLSFRPGPDVQLVGLWLAVAGGNYGVSKVTEIVAILKGLGSKIGLAGSISPGGVSPGIEPGGCARAEKAGGDS